MHQVLLWNITSGKSYLPNYVLQPESSDKQNF